jgi:hypothetical protein
MIMLSHEEASVDGHFHVGTSAADGLIGLMEGGLAAKSGPTAVINAQSATGRAQGARCASAR